MRLGQTSIIYFIAKVFGSIIGFFATIYFTRTLGEEIYGFYSITLALVSWLGIIKSVGFGQSIVKRMSEGSDPDAYLSAGIAVKAVLTITVAFGVFIFSEQVNEYVGQPVAEFVILLLIVSIFSGIVNAALKGSHKVHIYAPLSTVKQAIRSVTMIILVYIGWELSGMLLGYAFGTAMVATIGLLIVRPKLEVPQWDNIRDLFDFAKFSWLGSMRKRTFSDMDILVLAMFVPAGLTGIYAVAYALSEFLNIFGSAIKNTLFPEISKQDAAGKERMVVKLTEDALNFAGLFLIPGIVGATLLGDRLMRVYGDGFEIGAQVLTILLVGILIYSYNRQLLNTLNGINRPDLAFRSNAVFIISNLVLNVALVYTIGWVGAAIATASSAAIGFVVTFFYTRSQIGFTMPYYEVSRQWFAAIVMGVVVYIVRGIGEAYWIATYNVVFLLILVSVGATIYFITLLSISNTLRTTVSRNLPFEIP